MGARTPRVRIPPLAPLNPGRAVTRGGVHPSPRRAWWTSRSRHPGFHDSRAVGRTHKPDPRVRCSSQALRAHEPDGRVRSPCLLPQVPAAVATSPRSCPPTAALPPPLWQDCAGWRIVGGAGSPTFDKDAGPPHSPRFARLVGPPRAGRGALGVAQACTLLTRNSLQGGGFRPCVRTASWMRGRGL